MNRLQTLRIALALACAAACQKKSDAPGGPPAKAPPVPVNTAPAAQKDMPVDLRAIGNVESIATIEVKAQVGGELLAVNFQEGHDVKKGDLLFSIQPLLYETQHIQAEANLTRDRAMAANARRDAERNSALGTKGAISPEQLDAMRTGADAAEATVKADEALVKIARVRLGYASVKSPIDGRTGELGVQAGNLIKDNADNPMVTIKQMAPIYVAFAVPEQYLADIRKGIADRKLTVTTFDPKDARPLGSGDLTFVANAVDSTTGTIGLKATFPNDDRALWPGAFVDVVLHLDTQHAVTVVPASAVTTGQRGQQVFIVKGDGTAELRPVVVERTVAQECVIKQGIEPGEIVVTTGQLRLSPGANVIVNPPPAVAPAPTTKTSSLTPPTHRSRSIA